MTDEPQPEKKLVIDEDWKSQVEAEREAARRQESGEQQQKERPQEEPLPPPDLLYLASTLYYQAMVAMGFISHPITGRPVVNLEHARHTIDTIQMLQTKTEGNRTPEESAALDDILHELRMAYIAVEERRRTL